MAITVTSRPEKTLSSGYVSRWNASRTPLNYKFSSDLFPVNSVDTTVNVNSFVYDSSLIGTLLNLNLAIASSYSEGDYVNITSDEVINGVHKIINIIDSNNLVIDFFTNESDYGLTAPMIRYYKCYK